MTLGAQTRQALVNLHRSSSAPIRPALAGQPNPASTLVQAAALFRPGFLVEVEAVVALPDGSG